jgi:hypothetical protein
MNIAYRASSTDRRLGLLLTALVHLALVLAWLAARTSPAPAPAEEGARSRLLWIPLPLPRPAPKYEKPAPPRKEADAPRLEPRQQPGPAITVPPLPQATPQPARTNETAPAAGATPASESVPPKPTAAEILERAKRDVGSIARALRKENKPYIAAPLDSPQMRLRRGIEQAADMAPNAWYQAPKSEELVNNTGDGARRTRVITGNGSYCVTERSPATGIDMIEKHGKLRITNCPQHEEPARQQEWRTLRD